MNSYQNIFETIIQDPQYLDNLDWGKPRSGHPEGTVRAHITELEHNLARVDVFDTMCEDTHYKLRILIHTHDTFKPQSISGSAITDPLSHASLAVTFLAKFCDDTDLLAMVQWHDEPYAIWRKVHHQGKTNQQRVESLIINIQDWNLFLAFQIIDGCTGGKDRAPLEWLFETIKGRVQSTFTREDIL